MTREKVVLFLAGALVSLLLPAMAFPDGETVSPRAVAAVAGPVAADSSSSAAVAPAVKVAPSSSRIATAQALTVTVAVKGSAGKPTPEGTVTLTSGKFTSPVRTLADGGFKFHLAAGRLAPGNDVLTVTYTPSTASSPIYRGASGKAGVTVTIVTPTLTANLSSGSITSQQELTVKAAVSAPTGDPTPTGSVSLTSDAYASPEFKLAAGEAKIHVPPGSFDAGTDKLTITYSPDAESSTIYKGAGGAKSVIVTRLTPAVTVESSSTITTVQTFPVAVAVSAGAGDAAPTGTVKASSGSYTSAATRLANGSATIDIPPGSLTTGTDTLSVVYTPDTKSLEIYNPAVGTSSPVDVIVPAAVASIDQSSTGPEVTDQLIGMNMAAWFDPTIPQIIPAFQSAGIKAVRWPGGSWSDDYHWATNALCGGTPNSNATFSKFVDDLAIPAGLDVALTADYGTNTACDGPGDPSEAAAWVKAALEDGITVSHMTVGNEEYGDWETDMHSSQHDPTTYADSVTGTSGYYAAIKAESPHTLVGVSVNPGNYPEWDPVVLANAKGSYDFVEYHFYPQTPGQESDTYLTEQAAQDLTSTIDTIKSELTTAGEPDTPIYVGEMGSVYTDPGKQTTSITQALFAGQVLGEMMNDGVSRATWWIGFGGCSDDTSGNFSSSLYGWQNFGGYMVFSDGTPEYGCENATPVPAGTLLPTARAFQLFSKVAVTGESVLTPTVTGDQTDVRAYAATHSGGTALVLFNVNETTSQTVAVELSVQTKTSSVAVETYSKAIYDQSENNVWAPPTTTNLGAQSLPLALTLAPWSMNVVIIK
ncbi:MAG: hypothetical protein WBE76_02000 [Terracidiphilus sp.]